MIKTGRPSLEGFETEGEGVLARLKSIALIDHDFVLGEHVSSLEVLHSIVLIE